MSDMRKLAEELMLDKLDRIIHDLKRPVVDWRWTAVVYLAGVSTGLLIGWNL